MTKGHKSILLVIGNAEMHINDLGNAMGRMNKRQLFYRTETNGIVILIIDIK